MRLARLHELLSSWIEPGGGGAGPLLETGGRHQGSPNLQTYGTYLVDIDGGGGPRGFLPLYIEDVPMAVMIHSPASMIRFFFLFC